MFLQLSNNKGNIYRANIIFNPFLLQYILELFLTYLRTLFEHFLRPLSGVSWKTKIHSTDKLRSGCFSICRARLFHHPPGAILQVLVRIERAFFDPSLNKVLFKLVQSLNESAKKQQCLMNLGMCNFGALIIHVFGALVSAFGPGFATDFRETYMSKIPSVIFW